MECSVSMAMSSNMLLAVIRLALNECMPCRYGEPTTECRDEVHIKLIEVRELIRMSQPEAMTAAVMADMREIDGIH